MCCRCTKFQVCVLISLLFQFHDLTSLQALLDLVSSEDGAQSVTLPHLNTVIMCAVPLSSASASLLCKSVYYIVYYGGSYGYALAHDAGAIPIMFDCLRGWPDSAEIVWNACALLGLVTSDENPSRGVILEAIHDAVPDFESLLVAAQASRLDLYNSSSLAETVLENLRK
jgi:hypothetical protein